MILNQFSNKLWFIMLLAITLNRMVPKILELFYGWKLYCLRFRIEPGRLSFTGSKYGIITPSRTFLLNLMNFFLGNWTDWKTKTEMMYYYNIKDTMVVSGTYLEKKLNEVFLFQFLLKKFLCQSPNLSIFKS